MKKVLALVTTIVLAGSAYAAPVTDTVGVELKLNPTLAINASSTSLDFGEVAVVKGEVQSPTSTLTVQGTDTTQSVTLSVPKVISLSTPSGSNVEFLTEFTGSDGTVTDDGTDITWTANSAFAQARDSWTVDFGGKLNILGTEAAGDYAGTATITADYN